jgi:hypothetical protein
VPNIAASLRAFGPVQRDLAVRAARQAPEFAVFAGLEVALPAPAFARPALLPIYLRQALEAAWLTARGVSPGLAALTAARAAALFALAEADDLPVSDRAALPAWVRPMAADRAPAMLPAWGATAAEEALIRHVWTYLGSADALMETGGDIRLARDPVSGLNGYGCSHRARPWAITFASSTASSSSERGYIAADAARLRVTLALLKGAAPRDAVRAAAARVRGSLARLLRLPAGTKTSFAASGTDTELMALALAHLAAPAQPIVNILIAPEETGRGVPRAARGRHFAVDTAFGHAVAVEAPIAGFPADIALATVALRDAAGDVRPAAMVDAEVEAAVAAGVARGARVILHALDLSKTGLLAPGLPALARLRARFGAAFDLVVDACQARLSPASLAGYLALDGIVLITGSKFFTGPPFAGALLLPPSVAARLQSGAALPAGLAAYFGRDDLHPGCAAARAFPATGNYGLLLRWAAACAELRAFMHTPLPRRAEILTAFAATVRAAIEANPAFTLLDVPPLARLPGDEAWERCRSIFTFTIAAPHEDRPLTPEEARTVYGWLNTDLSALLPDRAALASRICHIGQPVAVPAAGSLAGALRVSAGARLIAGEPSHSGLRPRDRLARELADLRLVFDKIELIRRHWAQLVAAAPAQRYRPFSLTERAKAPSLGV